ncbi:SUMF1/EgtB/PvdO family nonheme iron enzyme [bacterium]|nr:SUMF1/EgtB/PvdO family nonheme iron enzyme [bacterium]
MMRQFSAILLLSLCLLCLFPSGSAVAEEGGNQSLAITSEWLSDHQLLLEWNRPRYTVVLERKIGDGKYFRPIAEFEDENEYLDDSLTVNTNYIYRLRPKPVWYLDEYGGEHEARFDLPPPAPPLVTRDGIDQVVVTAPQDSLQWEGHIDVEMRVKGVYDVVGSITSGDTTVRVENLETFKPQLFRLFYVSEFNRSAPSVADTVYLSFPPPTRLYVRALSDHSIQLNWNPPTDWPHKYEVQKLEGLDTMYFDVAYGDTFWVDENVDFDRTTFYRVRGMAGENIGDYSEVVSARLQMNTVENLQVDKVEDLVVGLTWDEPAPITTTYFVQRSINGGNFETIAELPSDVNTYTDYLPRRGLNVSYRIISANSLGDEAISDAVSQAVRTVAYGMMQMDLPNGESWFVDADEVSAAEYSRFCEETERQLPEEPDHASGGFWSQRNNMPAVMVTWQDAIDFCNWRSVSLGLEPAYDDTGAVVNPNGGFRLPSKDIYMQAIDLLSGGIINSREYANLLGPQDGFSWMAPGLGLVINPTTMVHMIGNASEWVQDKVPPDGRLAIGGAFSTPVDLIEEVPPETAYPASWYASTIGFRCILPSTVVVELEE